MHTVLPHVETSLNWLRQHAPKATLTADSRDLNAGDVFIAYAVAGADSRNYIEQAAAKGAAAILFEPDSYVWDDRITTPHLAVPGLAMLAGQIANAYYAAPDQGMITVAVTGTNGKTSCSQWLGDALSVLHGPCAVMGTLGIGTYQSGKRESFVETGYTTPDAVQLQRALAGLRDRAVTGLAIEASSIGLEQGRLNGLHFDAAIFTNLTRDHLDYHGSMDAYEAAKNALFDWPSLKHAVINIDDEMGLRLVTRLAALSNGPHVVSYSVSDSTLNSGAKQVDGVDYLTASDIRSTHAGTSFQLQSSWGNATVKIQLVGGFNVSNVLSVMGVLLSLGHPLAEVVAAAQQLEAVPGRMQQFGGQEAPLVVIDYAHTPDALEKTLKALRPVAEQRGGALWCVFGCGGDRDPGKRPQMGKVALLADHAVVTSDNPRSEDPAAIIAQIVAGMQDAAEAPQVYEDRAAAILWAVKHAAKQDVVLLAGKGHENYQEVKGRKLPFLDADHASLALVARVTMKGGA